jgi:NifU-like protein involved in Fe-S cluster formation
MPAPFSDTVMEYFLNPRNVGVFESPSGKACAGTPDGTRPYVCMEVLLEQNRVVGARFRTYGCVPAIAASSFLTEWATGKSLEDVTQVSDRELVAALGGLPADRLFCATLAVNALRAAIDDAMSCRGDAHNECTR